MGLVEENYSISFIALSLIIVLFAGSLIQRVLYNLYQHPLGHIPGPKLAGATYLYQTYFSLRGGKSRYYIKIAELHKTYGKPQTLKAVDSQTLINSKDPWCGLRPMKYI